MIRRKPVTTVVAAILFLIAALHLVRFVKGVPIEIGAWVVPMWASVAAFVGALALAVALWREARTFLDRRRHPRSKSLHLATLQASGGEAGDSVLILGRTLQLSDGGVMLETRELVEIGTEIDLELAVETKLVKAHGQVIHVETLSGGCYSLGIKFSQSEAEQD